MNDYLSLAIVAAGVSILVQFVKSNTMIRAQYATILLSIVAGAVYYLVRDTAIWQNVLQILLFANGIYSFIISKFE
jgi:hypothetical protein